MTPAPKRSPHWLLRHIPPRYHSTVVNLKNAFFDGYAQKHYSQFGEDIIVGELNRKPEGFYVDIGANHPKRYSNTALLYKKGWHGINVDPNPASIELFKHARPKDINIAVGIAKEKGTLPFYQFSDPAMNTFSESVAETLKQKRWLHFLGATDIEVMPLSTLLDTCVKNDQVIDFMNIDVEGLDAEVLKSNNWEKYKPKILTVEAHTFTIENPLNNETYAFLTNLGYRLKAYVGPTLLFVLL